MITSRKDAAVPWSPLGVSFITLFLPAGGAVLTIRNLERLNQVDATAARKLIAASVVVVALGYAALIFTAGHHNSAGVPQPDQNALGFLCAGLAFGSYLAQRVPFRTWRVRNADLRSGPWLPAIWIALLYQLAVIVCVFVLLLVGLAFGWLGNWHP
jgi:hypothetical protein